MYGQRILFPAEFIIMQFYIEGIAFSYMYMNMYLDIKFMYKEYIEGTLPMRKSSDCKGEHSPSYAEFKKMR